MCSSNEVNISWCCHIQNCPVVQQKNRIFGKQQTALCSRADSFFWRGVPYHHDQRCTLNGSVSFSVCLCCHSYWLVQGKKWMKRRSDFFRWPWGLSIEIQHFWMRNLRKEIQWSYLTHYQFSMAIFYIHLLGFKFAIQAHATAEG